MKATLLSSIAGLVLLALPGSPLLAQNRDLATVDSAVEVVRNLSKNPLHCIPHLLMHDAKAVAIIPNVVKAGLVVDHRSGHGLVMVRQPNGAWSDPVFVEIEGSGIGLEVGVESTDLVLVFRTAESLDRMLKGKLTLGTDAAVAAGPVGRDIETADRNIWGKAEIVSYSRSRGLFAGVSVAGSRLLFDNKANDAFYGLRGCHAEDIVARRRIGGVHAVDALMEELDRMSQAPMVKAPH
jgi:lipid-binding SYLF domain-containing protein